MSNLDNMYHDFFGKKSTNEADLINKISDFKGGFLYKLIDPATAGNVKADIQAFLNKKGMYVIKTKFDDAAGKGFFYIRLGEDPNFVFNTGCPSIDLAFQVSKKKKLS